MPAVSKRQQRLMQAVAHDRNFAKEVKIPQSVGREFSRYADGGQINDDDADPMDDTSWLLDGYADGGRLRNPMDPVGANLQFFNYDPRPIPVGVPSAAGPAAIDQQPGTNDLPFIPPSYAPAPIGIDGGGISAPGPAGSPGTAGANSGGIGVSPSSVSGTGIGSIASNIGMGSVPGVIAGLMGLAGMASPAVGVVGSIASLANSLGIQGLTNGIAVTNDQSTNNVANDAAAIAAVANAMGIGENSAGPVGPEAAASSPANSADSESGVGNSSADAADSGSTYRRGGRLKVSEYNRFKPQPFARGGRFW